MNLKLHSQFTIHNSQFTIEGSKSETNRLLILKALYPNILLENISNADDSVLMQKALNTDNQIIDINHSGTAMRFLTAYFAQKDGCEVVLMGSDRMHERPIAILVDALRALGANIEYIKNEGFPPLKITGSKITKNKVSMPANVSSQYISALMLIAPKHNHGLTIELIGQITSKPYIEMTLDLLKNIGVEASFIGNFIKINHLPLTTFHLPFKIESDWSSASYFYGIIALSTVGTALKLSNFKKNSLQGDSILVKIYKDFGVKTVFENDYIILQKKSSNLQFTIYNLQLNDCPDLAQTIAVTCFGLGIGCYLTGLHTLKIKETDRLLALKTELKKLGGTINITNDSLTLAATAANTNHTNVVAIDTYHDHRMAMAFAILAVKFPIIINDASVVSKSYPDFWVDLNKIGIESTHLI